jgi:Ca2+-binding RTX toxin-like protein
VNVSRFDRPATVAGGTGDDLLVCGRAHTLIGGGGDDKLISTAHFIIDLEAGDTDPEIELVDPRPSLLSGGNGNDTLVASGAPDSLVGGAGRDLAAVTLTRQAPAGEEIKAEDLIALQGVTLSGIEIISANFHDPTAVDAGTEQQPVRVFFDVGGLRFEPA